MLSLEGMQRFLLGARGMSEAKSIGDSPEGAHEACFKAVLKPIFYKMH
jgi:hypothetical protein